MNYDYKNASLKLSKKLVELGVRLKTEKKWVRFNEFGINCSQQKYNLEVGRCIGEYILTRAQIPAPDVAELVQKLPDQIYVCEAEVILSGWYHLRMTKNAVGQSICAYESVVFNGEVSVLQAFMEKELAQVLCTMLIFLLENKYRTSDEINLVA